MDPSLLFIVAWFCLSPIFLVLWILALRRNRRLQILSDAQILEAKAEIAKAQADANDIRSKYAPVISQEEEVARLKNTAQSLLDGIAKLRASYAEKRALYDELEKQLAIFNDKLSFTELGFYEPHFEFNDTEEYKKKILAVREQQKRMVSNKNAAICSESWSVEGSASKGQVMINRQTRLTLRAFNNECEAAIANVRWNNVVAMERRILNSASAINKENTSLKLNINDLYVSYKIEELRLTHEYRERLKVEKEERAEMARAEREEKKLLAEAEAAEREERKYQSLLDRARIEATVDSEETRRRIAELEAALAAAKAAGERARAMAELTKSGYIYIISNIGSFGDDVVKIGLTRRLDPDDRVKELGDASVPFAFDTHAMIYSDEAPALEAALHKEFLDRRINMSNMRKEFFRVTLDEVELAVKKLAPNANFFKDREAQEWHETLARRKSDLLEKSIPGLGALPASI